jgi:hypothetical protein
MPHLMVAVVVASIRRKPLAGLVATLLVGSNLLVFATYVTQLQRSGPYGLFTDATAALSSSLSDETDRVFTIDYGLWENVWLLHRGNLRMRPVWVLAQPAHEIEEALRDPRAVFVDHLPGHEYYAGSDERLNEVAKSIGLWSTVIHTIYDSKGRPQMEVFRFVGNSLQKQGSAR